MTALLPSASELATTMQQAVRGDEVVPDEGALLPQPAGGLPAAFGLVVDLVRSNLRQWDLEDATRDPHATDAVVAAAKRAIDRLNLHRHHLVQELDAGIAASVNQSASATLATESPGMVLDRLSVLVIRRERTAAASSRDERYAARLPALDRQVEALSAALDVYLGELRAGKRRFAVYEHLKLYGAEPAPRGGRVTDGSG